MIKQIQLLAGILFLGILVYSGLWYTAAFQAEKDVTALLADWRDKGVSVEHGKIEHGGFPYRITVNVKDVAVETRAGGIKFQADDVLLVSHLWTPRHWLIETNNMQASAAADTSVVESDFLLASYRVHDDGKTLVAFDGAATRNFSLIKLLGKDMPTPESWQLFFRFGGTNTTQQTGLYGERHLEFKLSAARQGTSIDFTGGMSGPVIKDWTKDQLTDWVNEGGLFEIDQLTLSSSGGNLNGNASLTLDEKLQPLGSAVLTFSNAEKLYANLSDMGLEIEAVPISDGPASVMLQNGALSINGSELAQLSAVLN